MQKANDDDGWWDFLTLCAEIDSAAELHDFFGLFMTIEERRAMADRMLIIRDLVQGQKTQREMADELHVSIAKITRGSNSLKIISDRLREFLINHFN